jgi:hypothetical protein
MLFRPFVYFTSVSKKRRGRWPCVGNGRHEACKVICSFGSVRYLWSELRICRSCVVQEQYFVIRLSICTHICGRGSESTSISTSRTSLHEETVFARPLSSPVESNCIAVNKVLQRQAFSFTPVSLTTTRTSTAFYMTFLACCKSIRQCANLLQKCMTSERWQVRGVLRMVALQTFGIHRFEIL